jgi:serine/threonine protein kinase
MYSTTYNGVQKKNIVLAKFNEITNDYDFKQKLGSGNYGKVYQARHRDTNQMRAVKHIHLETNLKNSENTKRDVSITKLCHEIELMIKVDHPNVVGIFEYYIFSSDLFISMELLSGKTLFEQVTQNKDHLTENIIRHIIRQLLEGVNSMHSSNVVHCDLKPENILFEDKSNDHQLKIIDLGLGQVLKSNSHLTVFKGTLPYVAPELIHQIYDHKVDIWAVGVILYILVTGKFPFAGYVKNSNGETVFDGSLTQQLILESEPNYQDKAFQTVDSSLVTLLQLMLEKNPNKRPNAKQLLTHEWFKSTQEKTIRKESN